MDKISFQINKKVKKTLWFLTSKKLNLGPLKEVAKTLKGTVQEKAKGLILEARIETAKRNFRRATRVDNCDQEALHQSGTVESLAIKILNIIDRVGNDTNSVEEIKPLLEGAAKYVEEKVQFKDAMFSNQAIDQYRQMKNLLEKVVLVFDELDANARLDGFMEFFENGLREIAPIAAKQQPK